MEETEKKYNSSLTLDIQPTSIQVTLNDKYESKQVPFLNSLLLEV